MRSIFLNPIIYVRSLELVESSSKCSAFLAWCALPNQEQSPSSPGQDALDSVARWNIQPLVCYHRIGFIFFLYGPASDLCFTLGFGPGRFLLLLCELTWLVSS